jgi:hypothetical protein
MKTIFWLFAISSLFFVGYRVFKSYEAEQNYVGYLKRAADANSVEVAKSELEKAIDGIEKERLTSGYTSILFKTPNEDIDFWYKNLLVSLRDLRDLPENSSPLEKSNMLMKLRETLLDDNKVTCPQGISIYPNNTIVSIWGSLSIIIFIFLFYYRRP